MVITMRNPVHSVLWLVLVFCNGAALLLLLEVEFLAMLFLVVYVGAIAVLFLFVVMMLNVRKSPPLLGRSRTGTFVGDLFTYIPIALVVGAVFLAEINIIVKGDLEPLLPEKGLSQPNYIHWIEYLDSVGSGVSSIENLGQVLYTHYFFYFLIAGIILLVAMIGAIVLTLQSHMHTSSTRSASGLMIAKRQHVYQQLSRDANNAVFLIKLYSFSFFLIRFNIIFHFYFRYIFEIR